MSLKSTFIRKIAAICSLPVFAVSLPAHADWHKSERAIMGTSVRVELWHADAAYARKSIDAVMAEMHRIDAAMSPYRASSELSRVNRLAASTPQPISNELFDLVERSLKISELSAGAFDITYASVGHLYNYRQKIAPSDAQITRALAGVDYRNIRLDRQAQTISFSQRGVTIDLGGIAKGYAIDRAVDILRSRNIHHALVSAGGDSRIIGDRRGRPWLTGIRDPRKSQGSAVVLPLSDTAFSTSGDYERFFIRDGVRYHHILTPSTGKPAAKCRSVTILGPDATTTDALSTTVFVLGAAKGLSLINRLSGIDAVIIDAHGALHYSSGLASPASTAAQQP